MHRRRTIFLTRRRFGENGVSVGAPEAERIDPGEDAALIAVEVLGFRDHAQIAARQIKSGVCFVEVQVGRNFSVMQAKRGLDRSRNPRRGFKVADVGFDRTKQAGLGSSCANRAGDRRGFTRVTDLRARPMGFHVLDLGRLDTRLTAGRTDQLRLRRGRGRGHARFASVLVRRGGEDLGVNSQSLLPCLGRR